MMNTFNRVRITAISLLVIASLPSKAFSWGAAHSYMTEAVAEAGLQGLDRGVYAPLLGDLALWADGWVKDGTSFSSEITVTDPKNLVIELARISNPYLDRIKGGKWTGDTKATQELMFHLGKYIAAAFRYTAPNRFSFPKTAGSNPPASPGDDGAGGCATLPLGTPASAWGSVSWLLPLLLVALRRSFPRRLL